jgi:KamA family protein
MNAVYKGKNMKLHPCFQKTLHTIEELERHIQDKIKDRELLNKIVAQYPLRMSTYYLQLINWDDPEDPIRRLAIPSLREQHGSGSFDTSGEQHNTKLRGLQHKYRETALILTTNVCSVYCRHCFRKRLVGVKENEVVKDWQQITDYLLLHTEITNVLLSGGDPLILDTASLAEILQRLLAVPHLQYVRIGSRIPVVLPERIIEDQDLRQVFQDFLTSGKQLYLTTQYNHPRELTSTSLKAIRTLQGSGVIVNNQTVLLKGVNDNPVVMARLQTSLARYGIIPYYVFQCRPVTTVKDGFQVPLRKACRIIDETRQQLDGLSKRFRFVLSHPTGKIEILGWEDEGVYAKYLQSNRKKLHNKIFHKRLKRDAGWLDWTETELDFLCS